jgi:dTDP-4-dehydrorhamnose reductase
MTRIALIGCNGQLGSDIMRLWPGSALAQRGDELVGLTHADIEVTDREMTLSVLRGVGPELVINTAAFHRVDDCETQAELALKVNALGVKNLAEACRDLGAALMHFSTDYVFDGGKRRPYTEDDAARPLGAYGISKLAGEAFLRYILPDDHILVRSAGLYGVMGASGKGGNFVETILRIAREGGRLRVVNDQTTAPTNTLDVAAVVLELIARRARGVFHVTNSGQCSWYEFADTILKRLQIKADFGPTTSAEYGARARRPPYSVLENRRLREIGISQPRPWREAIVDYLRLKGYLEE